MCSFGPFVHYQYECLSSMSPPPFKMTASILEYTWMWYIFHEFMAVCTSTMHVFIAWLQFQIILRQNKWTMLKLHVGTWLTVKRRETHICIKDVFTVTNDVFQTLWNITPIRNDISIPHNLGFYTILTNVPPPPAHTHAISLQINLGKTWQEFGTQVVQVIWSATI